MFLRHGPGRIAPAPLSHWVAELPAARPEVVEDHLHRLTHPACKRATRAALPPGVSSGGFDPRLLATVALPPGPCRLSNRGAQAAFADLLGIRISAGMVCKAERAAAEAIDPTRLDYAERLVGGRSIGSEMVEGVIEQLDNRHMKRIGARWSVEHVGPLVKLVAIADQPGWYQLCAAWTPPTSQGTPNAGCGLNPGHRTR